MPHLERLSRSQSGTLVTEITVGHVGKVLCVAFDKNFVSCGEDDVCVSYRVLLPPLLTDISQRIYMWDTNNRSIVARGYKRYFH
jgi:hypothetical protein